MHSKTDPEDQGLNTILWIAWPQGSRVKLTALSTSRRQENDLKDMLSEKSVGLWDVALKDTVGPHLYSVFLPFSFTSRSLFSLFHGLL